MKAYSYALNILVAVLSHLYLTVGDTETPGAKKNLLNCPVAIRECPNHDVNFYLSTSEHPEQKLLNMSSLGNNTGFMKNATFKILLHGWTENRTGMPYSAIAKKYFLAGNYNVIAGDYPSLVPEGCYVAATQNLPVVANCTAQLIEFLAAEEDISMTDIHVIGFSLGGQIAGQIGNYLKNYTQARITGLDPASPMFSNVQDDSVRLDAGDADFVDVVHTNAGAEGKLPTCGHVDFYMNGGSLQPGCPLTNVSCNHGRAPLYFAESIDPDSPGFWGYRCDNVLDAATGSPNCDSEFTALMGEHVNSSARGIFRVDTNSEPSFAIGKKRKTSAIKVL